MQTPAEEQRIAQVVERLAEKFPAIPREHVEQIVGALREHLADATVRDYIPVLIEHDAKEELREEEPQG